MVSLRDPCTLAMASPLAVGLVLAASTPGLLPAGGPEGPGLRLDGRPYQRLERCANTFAPSRQDRAALVWNAAGQTVLAWQSRRQQGGAYGIYARRFDRAGRALAEEVRLNASTRGMQMQPALAADADGGIWVAWRSFGHDGDRGAILARRFDGQLASATAEVIVNQHTQGNQTDPVIAALPDGGALVVWLTQVEDSGALAVHARRLGPDGAPRGDAFRVDAGEAQAVHRTPAVAADARGRVAIVYARTTPDGAPDGIFGRLLGPDGEPDGEELRFDPGGPLRAIEPALASTPSGDLLVGWLEAEGRGYAIRLRTLSRRGQGLVPGPIRSLESGDGGEAPAAGYTSGLALALDGAGRGLVAWNRHGDGPRRSPGLFARMLDEGGKPVGPAFRVTERVQGGQAIAPATGTTRALLASDGRMAFAWDGDGGLGDGSGAHLTLLAPEGLPEAPGAPAEPVAARTPPTFGEPDQGARPHDPPTFDRRKVVRDRPPTSGPGSGPFDFLAFTATGWTPPDPEMAVGTDHIVAIVNGGIAWFTKDGTLQFQQDINGAAGFWGTVGAGSFVFDPEVIYDPHAGRFMAFANERVGVLNPQGFLLLAVSDDGDPNGTWHKYRIDATPLANDGDIDSPNIAVDDQVIYMGADFFGPDKHLLVMIDKSSVLGGGTPVFTHLVINGRRSLGLPLNYDAAGPAQYMVWAEMSLPSTSVTLYAITNPLANPQLQVTTVAVPSYSVPADPPQMGTSVRPDLFEARFWSCVVRDGQLWATHHQGSDRSRVRWYQFDLAGWPSGGTPSLVQWGEVDPGPDISTFFGSVWVDVDQNMALTFARSSANEFISMRMAFRLAGDPPGTLRAPVEVIASTAPDMSGRWGDYSSTSDDPGMPDSFWGHHEYRDTGGWNTRIGRVDLCGTITSYCVAAPNSVGSGATLSTSGSASVAANDLVLTSSNGPSNQFGLFFYGQGQAQNPVGDGFLCIAGNFFRLPIVQADAAGAATFALDLNNLPAQGPITAGTTWSFQFWYRDPGFGAAFFNFSDAVEVSFCP